MRLFRKNENIKSLGNQGRSISKDSYNNIQDVLDVEKITNGVCDFLNEQGVKCRTNADGYYRDVYYSEQPELFPKSEDVVNEIIFSNNKTFDDISRVSGTLKFSCNDGLLTIHDSFGLDLPKLDNFVFSDLTNKDVEEIGKYILSKIEQSLDFRKQSRTTWDLQKTKKEIINTVKQDIEKFSVSHNDKFKYGSSRIKTETTRDDTVIVSYKGEPRCEFYVQLEDDALVVFCIDLITEKEIGDGIIVDASLRDAYSTGDLWDFVEDCLKEALSDVLK